MTAAESAERAQHYDPRDIQDKWQARWDGAGPVPGQRRPGRPPPAHLPARHVPVPVGRPAHGPRRGVRDRRRDGPVLVPARAQRAAPDRLGRVRAARRERGDQEQRAPGRLDLREHRDADGVVAPLRVSFDWSRRLHTCDPEYYHWNQWLFLRFFERGLAYRKDGYVNWCPNDQTVLANEQVVAGRCERCGTEVVRRKLTQWYFKITEYADRLLDDMAQLEGHWPDRVLPMQRNWIGRSDGRRGPLRDRGPRRAGHRLHHPPGHAVRRDVLRGRGRLRAGRGALRARAREAAAGRTWRRCAS